MRPDVVEEIEAEVEKRMVSVTVESVKRLRYRCTSPGVNYYEKLMSDLEAKEKVADNEWTKSQIRANSENEMKEQNKNLKLQIEEMQQEMKTTEEEVKGWLKNSFTSNATYELEDGKLLVHKRKKAPKISKEIIQEAIVDIMVTKHSLKESQTVLRLVHKQLENFCL
jgi:hypothetical protein